MLLQAVEVDREISLERCCDRDDDTMPWSGDQPKALRSSRCHVTPPPRMPPAAQPSFEPTAARCPSPWSASWVGKGAERDWGDDRAGDHREQVGRLTALGGEHRCRRQSAHPALAWSHPGPTEQPLRPEVVRAISHEVVLDAASRDLLASTQDRLRGEPVPPARLDGVDRMHRGGEPFLSEDMPPRRRCGAYTVRFIEPTDRDRCGESRDRALPGGPDRTADTGDLARGEHTTYAGPLHVVDGHDDVSLGIQGEPAADIQGEVDRWGEAEAHANTVGVHHSPPTWTDSPGLVNSFDDRAQVLPIGGDLSDRVSGQHRNPVAAEDHEVAGGVANLPR